MMVTMMTVVVVEVEEVVVMVAARVMALMTFRILVRFLSRLKLR